jgi:beta-N-acetylhexosaminidase
MVAAAMPRHAGSGPEKPNAAAAAPPGQQALADAALGDIDVQLANMGLEERVGQLLMVGLAGTEVSPAVARWVRERRVGGVALFARNIVNLAQTATFVRDLLALAHGHVPPFIALDQEGGNVLRIKDGATILPGNMTLGASHDPALAYAAGHALGVDLWRLGFNMNLAPVLDINSNPQNPVIGVRAYGEKPDLVGHMGAWFVRGQQEMGVAAVAKHFPGHGDTQTDSHFAMPTVDATMARLEAVELAPFREAIAAGLDAVMTAHIALPKVAEAPDLPATLSRHLLTDVLRGEMGFDGVIMTDGLEMQGIIAKYGAGRGAVKAVLAGADMPMVLWSDESREEVYQALLHAARQGEISSARLETSVRRILTLKARRGLYNHPLESVATLRQTANRNALHEALAQRIAQAGVTLVRNAHDVLPIDAKRHRRVVVLAPPGPFAQRLAQRPHTKVVTMPFVPSREQRRDLVAQAQRLARDGDLLVAAVVNRYHVDITHQVLAATAKLPSAVVSFASPYYIKLLPEASAYVCTYSYLDTAQVAAAEGVLGAAAMPGALPVTIPGLYAYGHHLQSAVAPRP